MKKVLITLAACVFLSGTTFLWSEEGAVGNECGKGENRWEQKMDTLNKELGLSEEQTAKIKQIKTAQHQRLRELRKTMKEKRKELGELLQKQEATPESVKPCIQEHKDIQSQMIDQRVIGIFAIKDILSPEQFVKFQKVTEEWREKHRGEKFREWRKNKTRDENREGVEK